MPVENPLPIWMEGSAICAVKLPVYPVSICRGWPNGTCASRHIVAAHVQLGSRIQVSQSRRNERAVQQLRQTGASPLGLSVHWRNEQEGDLDQVLDPELSLSRHVRSSDWPQTNCLRFIDPYGDTIFNQRQMPVLIREFQSSLVAVSDVTIQQVVAMLISC